MTPPTGAFTAGLASATLNSPGAGSTDACATVDFEKQCATVVYATPVELLRLSAE